MFVVRGDSSYRTIHDLKKRRVVFGVKTSGLVVMARHVLDGLRLDLDRDFDAVLLERAADGPPLVVSGEAAALWGAPCISDSRRSEDGSRRRRTPRRRTRSRPHHDPISSIRVS